MHFVRVNETKITAKIAFIVAFSAFGCEKESKHNGKTLICCFRKILTFVINFYTKLQVKLAKSFASTCPIVLQGNFQYFFYYLITQRNYQELIKLN